jgi:hypothetical protein
MFRSFNSCTDIAQKKENQMSHSLKLGLTVAALATLGLSAANPAAAQTTYNFQAGNGGVGQGVTYTGVGVLGNGANSSSTFNRETYIGGFTNKVGGGTGTVLDSNGASTALIFAYDATGFSLFGTATAANPGALLQTFGQTSNKNNISLKGLTPNTPFTAVFYSENGAHADGRQTKFDLTDSTFGTSLGTATTTGNSATAFTTGPGNYVTFTGNTDASGGIFATYASVAGGEGDFNGAQFKVAAAVPEALSSISLGILLGLGGIAVFVRKRSVTPKNAA